MNPQFYVLLMFESMQLFVPQDDIQSVEIIADVHKTQTEFGAVGWFGQEHGHGQNSPIFCLAEDLSLLLDIPEKREFFALLKSPELPVGIMCDEVENIDIREAHLHFQLLPKVMQNTASPITQLVFFQEKMGCICTGETLIEYLAYLSNNYERALLSELEDR